MMIAAATMPTMAVVLSRDAPLGVLSEPEPESGPLRGGG